MNFQREKENYYLLASFLHRVMAKTYVTFFAGAQQEIIFLISELTHSPVFELSQHLCVSSSHDQIA